MRKMRKGTIPDLAHWRERAGYTQEALARLAGLSTKSIYNMEIGLPVQITTATTVVLLLNERLHLLGLISQPLQVQEATEEDEEESSLAATA